MKQFLFRSTAFVVLLYLVSLPIAWYFNNHYHTYNKQHWILQQKNLSLDYAVLGSSRVFNVVDINAMDRSSGLNGINLGTSGGSYAENYIVLNEFLKQNHIKTLLLSADEFNFNIAAGVEYPFHDYEFLHLFSRYDSIFKDYMPAWKYQMWKLVPAARFIEFNDQYTIRNKPDTALDHNKGSELLYHWGTTDMEYRRQTIINDIDRRYFFDLLKLCETNHIKVVLFSAPIFRMSHLKPNAPIESFLDQVCSSKKLQRIQAEGLIDTDNKTLFLDYRHANAKGSKIFSSGLGKKLAEIQN